MKTASNRAPCRLRDGYIRRVVVVIGQFRLNLIFSVSNFEFVNYDYYSSLSPPSVFSNGSRGGARGGRLPLFLDQTEAPRAEKYLFGDQDPPYPKVWIRYWFYRSKSKKRPHHIMRKT